MTTTNVNLSKSSNYRFENGKLQRHANAGWFDQDFTRCARNVGKFKIYAEHIDCAAPYTNYYVADTETSEVFEYRNHYTEVSGSALGGIAEQLLKHGIDDVPEPKPQGVSRALMGI